MVAFGGYFGFNTLFLIAMAFHCRFFFAERYCNVTQEQLYDTNWLQVGFTGKL